MPKKHRKQRKKSKKQPERFEHGVVCGETMDLWVKLGKTLLRKPEPKVEPLPKLEGRDALPPFLKNSWG